MNQILIIEDQVDFAELLGGFISKAGMNPHYVYDGAKAIDEIKRLNPDLIVLDLNLPNMDGLTICRALRKFSDIPVIISTARKSEEERLRGFELGATDYQCKPYRGEELVARIKSLLKLYNRNEQNNTKLLLDNNKNKVSFEGKSISISPPLFRILSLLTTHPEQLYSREQIMQSAYSDIDNKSDRSVDSNVKELRKKLRDLGFNDNHVHSVYGGGYMYKEDLSQK